MELPKTEYNFLLGFYLNLMTFDPMTSTFKLLSESERKELLLTIGVLQRKLGDILPRVQDRESMVTSYPVRTNAQGED